MRDVLFDLDGTLINSKPCIFSIYRKLFAELGISTPPEETMNTFIGPPVEAVITRYVKQADVTSACVRFRELYKLEDLSKTNSLYDGVKEMLATLYDGGKRLFIASTKNEYNANRIPEIFGVKKYFTAIYGSRSEIGRLSKAQVLEDLCRDNGIAKDDAVLVGDTHFDAEGAAECGLPVVIVNYGFGDRQKLKAYDVKAYFDTPMDVAAYCMGE